MTNTEITILVCSILGVVAVLVIIGIICVYRYLKKRAKRAKLIEELAKKLEPIDPTEEVGEDEEPLGEYVTPEGITIKKETTDKGKGYSFYKVRSDGVIVPLTKSELISYLTRVNKKLHDDRLS